MTVLDIDRASHVYGSGPLRVSALDDFSLRVMFGLMAELNKIGTTVVYVTHDQALAGLASRIVSVRDGLIVADTGRRP